ncbi:MAG: sugar phosphate isomerase/epimerase [Chloroflexi bacterium]|nr:sugar phosphate isomerase/epimerase [Chloroflexota bacterium]MCL5075847.1 sugar phosphate isomerase/epimerase [Chloroflexota bacterium]
MRLSFSSTMFLHRPLDRSFSWAAALGFDGLELIVTSEVRTKGNDYLSQLSERYKLPVLSVHEPIYHPRTWLRDYERHYRQVIDIALDLPHCEVVVFHKPILRSLTDATGKCYLRLLEECRNRLARNHIRLTIENGFVGKPDNDGFVLTDLNELKQFVEEWNLQVTLDTSHAGDSRYGILAAYTIFQGHIGNIHLSDLRPLPALLNRGLFRPIFKHHQIPGQGILPLTELLRVLANDSYGGPITLEISPWSLQIWSKKCIKEGLTHSILFCRNHFVTGETPDSVD